MSFNRKMKNVALLVKCYFKLSFCEVIYEICMRLYLFNYSLICFYWIIVGLQCCIHFLYIAKWLSYIHIYIYIHFYILFHYGLSQDIEYNFLCYTVRPCCLFIPCVMVWFANPKLLVYPSSSFPLPWQPEFCSLCLWVCFYFVSRFLCVII